MDSQISTIEQVIEIARQFKDVQVVKVSDRRAKLEFQNGWCLKLKEFRYTEEEGEPVLMELTDRHGERHSYGYQTTYFAGTAMQVVERIEHVRNLPAFENDQYLVICLNEAGEYVLATRQVFRKSDAEEYAGGIARSRAAIIVHCEKQIVPFLR